MKITTKPLKEALTRLRGISSGRTTMPILHCIKLESDGANLSITASDLDSWQVERVESDEKLEPICVNFKHFESAIGGEYVTITKDGNHIIIKHGKSVMKLATMSAEEFPKFPDAKYSVQGVNVSSLATAINAVKFAPDAKHENITRAAIHFMSKAKELYVEGTNGRCAGAYCEAIIGPDFECAIPISMACDISIHLERKDAEFHLSERTAKVAHADGEYICKLLDCPYPNTAGFLGTERHPIGETALKPIIETLEACLAVANGDISANAQMVFSKTGLWLGFTSAETQIENEFEGKFKDLKLGIHCQNLSRCLKAIKEEKAKFSYSDNALFIESGNLLVCSAKMIAKTVEVKS